MPIPSRTAILRGPCIITFNSVDFISKDDVTARIKVDTFDINTSAHGKVDERRKERMAEVSFTPAGNWAELATLFPYGSFNIGQSMFTGTDKTLKITSVVDGRTITFAAAAITKMPDIIISATKTALGSMSFTCLGANQAEWTDANSFYTTASGAIPTPAIGTIPTNPASITWAAPLTGVNTAEGVIVSFGLQSQPLEIDATGQLDMTFTRLDVTCKFRPVGLTEDQALTMLALQGGSNNRGSSLNTGSADLIIAASPITVTLKNANMKELDFGYGPATLNIGETTFVATKAAGVALFTVS